MHDIFEIASYVTVFFTGVMFVSQRSEAAAVGWCGAAVIVTLVSTYLL